MYGEAKMPDEMYGDVKMPGYDVGGCIIWG
jgi:hypothetical protein